MSTSISSRSLVLLITFLFLRIDNSVLFLDIFGNFESGPGHFECYDVENLISGIVFRRLQIFSAFSGQLNWQFNYKTLPCSERQLKFSSYVLNYSPMFVWFRGQTYTWAEDMHRIWNSPSLAFPFWDFSLWFLLSVIPLNSVFRFVKKWGCRFYYWRFDNPVMCNSGLVSG